MTGYLVFFQVFDQGPADHLGGSSFSGYGNAFKPGGPSGGSLPHHRRLQAFSEKLPGLGAD